MKKLNPVLSDPDLTPPSSLPFLPSFTSSIGGISQLVYDLRSLHKYLKLSSSFVDWVDKSGVLSSFIEDKDYTVIKFLRKDGKIYKLDYLVSESVALSLLPPSSKQSLSSKQPILADNSGDYLRFINKVSLISESVRVSLSLYNLLGLSSQESLSETISLLSVEFKKDAYLSLILSSVKNKGNPLFSGELSSSIVTPPPPRSPLSDSINIEGRSFVSNDEGFIKPSLLSLLRILTPELAKINNLIPIEDVSSVVVPLKSSLRKTSSF